MSATIPIIETRELTRVYRMGSSEVRALKGVDLSVQAGEFIALMGASGSGKSTLMHLLGCLDTPTSGRYLLESREVSRLSRDERARVRNTRIGFVFQTFNLLPRLNALDNVALPLLYQGHDQRAVRAAGSGGQKQASTRARAEEALRQVGLANRAGHRPAELSGGERQRVAIARALITGPAIILADEPTGNLDSAMGEEIMGLLLELNRAGHTIILVTHDAQVASHARRLLRMRDGRLIDD
jgi:putative ABC transport system ATP-binding protein